jgi:hypothetical protein
MKIFYKCKLKVIKSDFLNYSSVTIFSQDTIYEAIDEDDKDTLLQSDVGDYEVIPKMKMRRHFRRVNIMPEFSSNN